MASKIIYARQGQNLSATFLNLADDIAAWRNTYFDRDYDSGGDEEIVDGDVSDLGITAAMVSGLITAADALDTYIAANRAYMSRMRNDL